MFKKRIKLGSLNSGNMLTKLEFTGFMGFFFFRWGRTGDVSATVFCNSLYGDGKSQFLVFNNASSVFVCIYADRIIDENWDYYASWHRFCAC